MKILGLLAVILAPGAIMAYEAKSWGLPEITSIVVGSGDLVEPNLLQCLNVAYNYYINGLKNIQNLRDPPVIEEENLKAHVPSPRGGDYWYADELMYAAIMIVDNNNLRSKGRFHTVLTNREISEALELLIPPSGVVENTELLLNIKILSTLNRIMKGSGYNKGITKAYYKIEIPVVDVSMWTYDEIVSTLRTSNANPRLVPYLKEALVEPRNFLDDGENFCLVTPIHVLPSSNGDSHVPWQMKQIISDIRSKFLSDMWRSVRSK